MTFMESFACPANWQVAGKGWYGASGLPQNAASTSALQLAVTTFGNSNFVFLLSLNTTDSNVSSLYNVPLYAWISCTPIAS
jgi:hypothetical protein